MAAAIPELLPPGVTFRQEFEEEDLVTVLPSLPPVVVGVCNEINELYDADGALNADVLVTGPALATAPNDEASYTVMASLTLELRVNGGAIQTFEFAASAGTLTAQQAASAINGASPAPIDFAAYVYEDSGGLKHLQLRTLAAGSSKTIQVLGGTSLSKFGWGEGQTFYGLGTYVQDDVWLKQEAFPDPKAIGADYRDIDEDSIRVFLDLGTVVPEVLRTQTFLRKGATIAIHNDGDGDQRTPYVDLSENLISAASSAAVTGIVNIIATPSPVHGRTLILQVDGGGKQSVTFVGQPILSVDMSGWVAQWAATIQNGTMVFTVNGVTVTVTFGAGTATIDALITDINTQAVATVGANIAYRCDDHGKADAGGGYAGFFYGALPATTVVENTSVVVPAQAHAAANLVMGAATAFTQTNWGTKPHADWPIDSIVTQINELFDTTVASMSTNFLRLTSPGRGYESKIEIDTASSAVGAPQPTPVTLLGLDIGATNVFYGNPFPVRVGDSLYAGGAFLGNVLEVHSGAVSGRLRLDTEVLITATWSSWYIIAKNLNAFSSSAWGVTVPTPDLILDSNNDVLVKHDIVRDITGTAVETVSASMYVIFTALRKDVTAQGNNTELVTYADETSLAAALGPLTPENPLGYGMWLAMQEAPTVSVYGLGVADKSEDYPEGTLEGFTEAFSFLESKPVYAIAALTSQTAVHSVGSVHVQALSAPTGRKPCVYVGHVDRPSELSPTIVGSGNDGDLIPGGPPWTFDTKLVTLSQLLLDADVDPASITVADGVYLDFGDDAHHWNVTGAVTAGTVLTLNFTFAAGENDDGYYAALADLTVALQQALVSASFSVVIRGAAVSSTNDEVVTLYNNGKALGTRRAWLLFCDQLKATVNSVEQLIPGYFAPALKVGKVGGNVPGAPMTGAPYAVVTDATGVASVFTDSQLNKIAAGGIDITWVPAKGAAVQSRHQLTTDVTTAQRAEQSITVALDYCEIFVRTNLSPLSGRYNLTPTRLAAFSAIFAGLALTLVDVLKVVAAATPSSITQDASDPRKMRGTLRVTPVYPGNEFDITMVI
jgi:hypothetical protein